MCGVEYRDIVLNYMYIVYVVEHIVCVCVVLSIVILFSTTCTLCMYM